MYHFGVFAVTINSTNQPLRHNSVRVVYVLLCNQMIDQPGLKSLHIKVVHVPLERQWSLKLIVISHNAILISEGWYMYRFAFKCLN